MTDTIDDVAAEAAGQEPVEPAFDEQSVAEQLVAQAREKGIELVGPDGLLGQLTKRVLETALEAEMTDHLSCACRGSTSIMLPPRTLGLSASTGYLTMTSVLTLPASLDRPGHGSPVTSQPTAAAPSPSRDRSVAPFIALTRSIPEMGLMRRSYGYYSAKLIGALLILAAWVVVFILIKGIAGGSSRSVGTP